MKVSFVVPIYKKSPEQVKRSLTSLIEQSHRNLEIVVVFDGPDEELEKVVAELPRKKEGVDGEIPVKVIVREKNGGAPAARNTGFRETTGDVVSFWDADCYAEPEMVGRWVMEFEEKPHADFVYSGYAWTDPSLPGFDSEIFDPWLLKKYNYIATMFPVKHSKVVEWDETLSGLQDWDFWRRVVDGGARGSYIPGYAFTTDWPDDKSISGKGDKVKERVKRIREKHKDDDKRVLVCGGTYKYFAIGLAKVLDADYLYNPFYLVKDYDVIISLGLHPNEIKQNMVMLMAAGKDAKRVIYWTGFDADILENSPYKYVKEIKERMDKEGVLNWAWDKKTRQALEGMGFKVNMVPFPHFDGKVMDRLPPTFKVLYETDGIFQPLTEAVIKAMPDIPYDIVTPDRVYNIEDYSVCVQLTQNLRLGEGSKNFLRQARYVVSNVEAPHSGFVDLSDLGRAKAKIVRKIREVRKSNMPNLKAQKYYLEQSNPAFVREEVARLTVPVMNPVEFHVS